MAESSLAQYALGCTCHLGDQLLSVMERAERLGKQELELLTYVLHLEYAASPNDWTDICTYGWFHGYYVSGMRNHTGCVHACCLDFLGLATSLGWAAGILEFLDNALVRLSSYYKGYLVICATACFERWIGRWSNEAKSECSFTLKLIERLLLSGGNMIGPHILPVNQDAGQRFLVKTPASECLIFLLRLTINFQARLAIAAADLWSVTELLGPFLSRLKEPLTWVIENVERERCLLPATQSEGGKILLQAAPSPLHAYVLSIIFSKSDRRYGLNHNYLA